MEFSEAKLIKISWHYMAVLVILVFGFGGWMTVQELRAQDHEKKLDALERIDKRLYRIEYKLGIEGK